MELEKQQKEILVRHLQAYLDDEFSVELGRFEVQALFDHMAEQFGPYFYNQALQDAQTILSAKMADLEDCFYQLEKIPPEKTE